MKIPYTLGVEKPIYLIKTEHCVLMLHLMSSNEILEAQC